ncbi:Peptidase B [Hyphomicrobium sulfonivorans]|uniref:Peptidase B n=1 Tax=Hyphomicrobium sulfonivorans TaxID=121290 RepID=A0A125NTQ2_HYPSL|nr:leucyl aminopeptidase family protein [Hyphomicrobium sulfonivorans]KWT64225.1 Peptidase B [Hyphomicrobium sulfonivorans]
MSDESIKFDTSAIDEILVEGGQDGTDIPIWAVAKDANLDALPLLPAQRAWAEAMSFKGSAKQHALLPDAEGRIAAVLFGMGDDAAGEPSGSSELLFGKLAQSLPAGNYHLAAAPRDPTLAAIAWGLGAYRFNRYRSSARKNNGEGASRAACLRLPKGADRDVALNTIEAVRLGRDLINTPASDLGPAEIEAAARALAARHNADISVIVGDELLEKNFPMIHAVGRASPRAPRLIDLTWGREGARTVTLVGKGITFDTGGLDVKPASAMLLMKKDMGGSAAALTLAHMIMGQKLDVRLRVLIPTAENSISGDAFRPGDVLTSRAGTTVEIGNTDAEGRLVLADAIALADEGAPQGLYVFATLTGAARVALGPDLPAMFTDDDAFAAEMVATSAAIGDPVWRLPLWAGYNSKLESPIADMNNVWESPFAGSITAALFLKRFAKRAQRFAHFDLFGWRPAANALGPRGGEPQTARAVCAVIAKELELIA